MERSIAKQVLLRRIRILMAAFIVCLAASGLTAIPVEWELGILARIVGPPENVQVADSGGLAAWVARVREGVRDTNARWPFIAYAFDWLAFAHIMIAVFLIGVIIDPVRNRWLLVAGMIACILIIPWAFIFGAARGIPFEWRLIDCAFGVIGFLPLWIARRWTLGLATAQGSAANE